MNETIVRCAIGRSDQVGRRGRASERARRRCAFCCAAATNLAPSISNRSLARSLRFLPRAGGQTRGWSHASPNATQGCDARWARLSRPRDRDPERDRGVSEKKRRRRSRGGEIRITLSRRDRLAILGPIERARRRRPPCGRSGRVLPCSLQGPCAMTAESLCLQAHTMRRCAPTHFHPCLYLLLLHTIISIIYASEWQTKLLRPRRRHRRRCHRGVVSLHRYARDGRIMAEKCRGLGRVQEME